mmetsp:Transcript_152489/g.266206  ORF Transcript_152489/g.266206 Transcript_152489/m.266206 type:complete len:110 (-) Transcript_152489:805-1134(-)
MVAPLFPMCSNFKKKKEPSKTGDVHRNTGWCTTKSNIQDATERADCVKPDGIGNLYHFFVPNTPSDEVTIFHTILTCHSIVKCRRTDWFYIQVPGPGQEKVGRIGSVAQ